MESIRLIGRSSRLSVIQLEKVREKIEARFPQLPVQIITRESRGDALQDIPLQTVEGSDFFTHDIFNALTTGEADIAVHSLKDMSSEHFFGANRFAVVDRDDARDVAIFSEGIEDRLRSGASIVVGTCSPRREEMATQFLQKALPQLGSFHISTRPVRGNIDTRLRKLHAGDYDAIILATAGLNRLLSSGREREEIRKLLSGRKLMVLPLIECVPAPCQGAIVAECVATNTNALAVIKAINDEEGYDDCVAEKRRGMVYGQGCVQQFGVATIATSSGKFVYAAGKNSSDENFVHWTGLPEAPLDNLFAATDHMRSFFEYEQVSAAPIDQPAVFVANHKAVQDARGNLLKEKMVFAAGTRTWLELARQGYWISGCADGLGLKAFLPVLLMPLIDIDARSICIITHEAAARRWREKSFLAVATYRLLKSVNPLLKKQIEEADSVFWTSVAQYELYGQFARKSATHISPAGETATYLKQQGLDPLVFPTIKSFEEWRKISIPRHSAA